MMDMRSRLRFLVWLLGILGTQGREVCLGTHMLLDVPSSLENHYQILKLLYSDCQVVHGNLEITHLHGDLDLTFLQGIEEVQGYVLIAHVTLPLLPLDNLRLIRGSQLYDRRYSLVVIHNTGGAVGLHTLRLRSLRDILSGGLYIWDNDQLCFPDPRKIVWKGIIDVYKYWIRRQTTSTSCPKCVTSCNGACWGHTAEDCQTFTHTDCAPSCVYCRGPLPHHCCHQQCTAGCTGPRASDCLACRHYNNSGVCQESCPPSLIYDTQTFQYIRNKNRKLTFGASCVDTCPHNYLATDVSCESVCPTDYQEVVLSHPDGTESHGCEKCKGSCPKVCYGLGMGSLQASTMVTANNVEQFVGCKKIYGSLAFLSKSFTGGSNVSGLSVSQLDIFTSVEEITGYLYVEAWPDSLSDLSVFENVKVIRGRMLYKGLFSLAVQNLCVRSLGLSSLREVSAGLLLLHNNSQLCFTSSINWESIASFRDTRLLLTYNQDPRTCEEQGHVCDPLCEGGCWGPGPLQCFCRNFQRGRVCVDHCDINHGDRREFVDRNVCVACHSECRPINGSASCHGPGPDQCTECVNFQDGEVCVDDCPSGVKEDPHKWTFANATRHCVSCGTSCTLPCQQLDERGCPLPVSSKTLQDSPFTAISAAIGAAVLFAIIIIILFIGLVFHMRRQKTVTNLLQLQGVEAEPLIQRDYSLYHMRILKTSDLKQDREFGSGAFGTVYKGVLAIEDDTFLVAIRVLNGNASAKATMDILHEANVLAGINNANVCRLLGICLTGCTQVQLVFQLMPYGSLLDYIQENQGRIGADYLLEWCVQIAQGMCYLEAIHLVHQNLAARNVLVKSPKNLKISDVGLERLLDSNNPEDLTEDSKEHIRWRALESIPHSTFTHQSDVWSYGVTVWELMTFGSTPYNTTPARDLPDLLERGERLPLPSICTNNIYKIMLKCWVNDPERRPRFKELHNEFGAMAEDPLRYVDLQNDEQRSLGPGESKFYRKLLEEEGENMWDLLGIDKYLVNHPETPAVFCQRKLKLDLKEKFKFLFEASNEAGQPTPQNYIYTELYITEGESGVVNLEHEVRQMEIAYRKPAREETPIILEDILKPLSAQDKPIRTLMTKGVAGIGKTVLTQKFTLDWAEDKTNHNVHFIFPFTFRKLNLLNGKLFSLVELLHHFFPETKEAGICCSYDKFHVLFILDGLDECRLPLDFQNNEVWTDITESTSVDVLLTNLINGNLLPSSRLWITSRPAAANQILPECIDMVTELRGFTDTQKDEYFRKRSRDEAQASRIISHIKMSQSLHVMCQIPVFCWITATVLDHVLTTDKRRMMPTTLTDMCINLLLVQMKQENSMHHGRSGTVPHWNTENKEMILSLGKLAFEQLEKGHLLFYETDLTDCGIKLSTASEYSRVLTHMFLEECWLYQDKVFCFVHLSIQEFLAALHVFLSFVNTGVNQLSSGTKATSNLSIRTPIVFLRSAVDNALQSENGHLDLFLCFLLGLSLETNQKLLQGLMTQGSSTKTNQETVQYIKKKLNENISSEKSNNLLHCLNELKDCSLLKESQQCLSSGDLNRSPGQWSALVFTLLSSEEELDMFDLKKYHPSEEGLHRLLLVVKASSRALLDGCSLSKTSCEALASLLSCKSSCLRQLDLSNNRLQDSGVKLLSVGLESPHCRLEKIRLGGCNLTERSCDVLASLLSSKSSSLRELDLSNNDLQDSGVKLLSAGLESPHCTLEKIRLSGCLVTEAGCASLASALSSNPSYLRELDLSYNHLNSGVKLLSAGLQNPQWRLDTLSVDHAEMCRFKPGLSKYACKLTLDPKTVNNRLALSEDNRKVTWVKESQSYPGHRKRFTFWPQVLCREGLNGRCYWVVDWREGVNIGVTYRAISRKGQGDDSCLGENKKSWVLECHNTGYTARHNSIPTPTSLSSVCHRVGVYVDWSAGSLSFYTVSSDTLTHLHTFYCTFTEPLVPGFSMCRPESSVSLCQIK